MSPMHPAARQARDRYRPSAEFFDDLGLQIPAPEPVPEPVELADGETDAVYDLAHYALEGAPEGMDFSCDVARPRAASLNLRLVEIAQRNVSSAFEFARNLAACGTIAGMAEVQMTFWREQLTLLANEAEDVRELQYAWAARADAPIDFTRKDRTNV
ncbi:MAG: phasin family protein [Methyloceanibacter sp.]